MTWIVPTFDKLEARQLTKENVKHIAYWCDGTIGRIVSGHIALDFFDDNGCPLTAYEGDWIIKGLLGEFAVCDDETLKKNFEEA